MNFGSDVFSLGEPADKKDERVPIVPTPMQSALVASHFSGEQ